VDVMGWCYVVILIEFCIFSICLLWLESDYRKDKNKNISTFDCFFAFLSKQCLLMVGLPTASHFIFIYSALLSSRLWCVEVSLFSDLLYVKLLKSFFSFLSSGFLVGAGHQKQNNNLM
jgi:hypothetical protein